LAWFVLASHLHTPLQEVKQKTSSTDFMMWLTYLELDLNLFHREDYYLAQIAAEIRRGNVKQPRQIRVKDFILEFKREKVRDTRGLSLEDRTSISKRFWKAVVGFTQKRKQI